MPDDIQLLTINAPGALTVGVLPNSIEVPANGEIGDVVLTVGTAPVGASLIVDVLQNGTSVFAGNFGTVFGKGATSQNAPGQGVLAADQQINVQAPAKTPPSIEVGQTLQLEAEQVTVTAVQASSAAGGGNNPVQVLTVTRGANGTTAANHAVGTPVTPAKPFIPAGSTKSAAVEMSSPAAAGVPSVSQGDVLTASVLQVGSTTAGSNLDVEIQLLAR
jgi:hypothetical protein